MRAVVHERVVAGPCGHCCRVGAENDLFIIPSRYEFASDCVCLELHCSQRALFVLITSPGRIKTLATVKVPTLTSPIVASL